MDIEFSVISGSNESMLFDCVRSLNETMRGSALAWQVTITCNPGSSGLAARLKAAFPFAAIIENASQRGFATNHNAVLARSDARYVWLLNDDLLLLPNAVRKVTEFLDRPVNLRVAVVSPRLLNPDGTLQPSTYGFPSMPQILLAHSGLRDRGFVNSSLRLAAGLVRRREGSSRFWAHDRTVEVDTLRGACVAMRMAAVRDVGLMVEIAQVGAEETEWHRRFHEHNWKVVFFPEAEVIHFGSQTVADGSRNHLPEYLKGALYFFRTGRTTLRYRAFTGSASRDVRGPVAPKPDQQRH